MTEDERACPETLLAREYVYTLFSKVLGGEPTAEFLTVMVGEATLDVLGPYAAEDETIAKFAAFARERANEAAAGGDFLDRCRSEHVAVAYGFPAGGAVPSESFYCSSDHAQLSEVTLAVRDFYRRLGVLPARYPRVPDDGGALEFAFMAELAGRSVRAFEAGDGRALVELLRAQSEFLAVHLGAWLPQFARDMRTRKEALLYPQLVQAMEAFLPLDEASLNNIAFWLAERAEEAPSPDGEGVLAPLEDLAQDEGVRVLKEALATLRAIRLPYEEDFELRPTD